MGYDYTQNAAFPGIHTADADIRQTVESEIFWGPWEYNKSFVVPVFLDASAARDEGSTTNTVLRAGLLLGQVASSKLLVEWDPTATDGSQDIFGPLLYTQETELQGTDTDRWFGFAAIGGLVKPSKLIIPGASSTAGIDTKAEEQLVVSQMAGRFHFQSSASTTSAYGDFWKIPPNVWGQPRITAKTANYTVLVEDNGTLFTNAGASGAVVFTLPANAKNRGLNYKFFAVANQNLKVAAATANTIVTFNDATADSVSFETSNEKIGGFFELIGADNSKWYCIPRIGQDSQTITIA